MKSWSAFACCGRVECTSMYFLDLHVQTGPSTTPEYPPVGDKPPRSRARRESSSVVWQSVWAGFPWWQRVTVTHTGEIPVQPKPVKIPTAEDQSTEIFSDGLVQPPGRGQG
jgi:hypothetical protein